MSALLIHRLGCLASALPYAVLSYVLIQVWRDPMSVDDGSWVRFAVGLMALEFLLLHSGAFMASFATREQPLLRRIAVFCGLFVFYSLMAWGFSQTLGSAELLRVYGLVMAGRLVTVITASNVGREQLLQRSGVGIAFYLLAVFLTLFVPLPEWGITGRVLAEVYPDRGGGAWERDPQIAIAAGALYFALLSLYEFSKMRGLPMSTGARD